MPFEEPFGDVLEEKDGSGLRLSFLNIRGFSTRPLDAGADGRLKDLGVCRFIEAQQVDVMLMAETNVHWKSLPDVQQPYQRFKPWFAGLKMVNAYYKNFQPDRASQFGGCAVWSINETVNRFDSQGQDPSGLGRWAWT